MQSGTNDRTHMRKRILPIAVGIAAVAAVVPAAPASAHGTCVLQVTQPVPSGFPNTWQWTGAIDCTPTEHRDFELTTCLQFSQDGGLSWHIWTASCRSGTWSGPGFRYQLAKSFNICPSGSGFPLRAWAWGTAGAGSGHTNLGPATSAPFVDACV